jgi:cellulose synthase/poly-beta-1,6-N-acetylglucosamine synthase-like glycosyltransferase
MLNFYLIWSFSYVLLLWLISRTWKNQHSYLKVSELKKSVSVVIPFRNELENLPDLIRSIRELSQTEVEILLIDDQSDDGSFEFLENNIADNPEIRILKSPGAGKKEAIEFGVKYSAGEIILSSDADCYFGSNWVSCMVAPFTDERVQLVAGPVLTLESDTVFQRFQRLDWASILVVTNYFFQKKNPVMCSAANMAYRKSTFLQVNGFEGNKSFLSGDDEFLLKKITSQYSEESCVYLSQTEVLVMTKSMKSWPDLLNQRIRWAGKWKAHQSLIHGLAALIPFLIQVIWILSVVFLVQIENGGYILILSWSLKIIIEKQVLGSVLIGYSFPSDWIDSIVAGLAHPIYVMAVGVGVLRGKFNWKGRNNLRNVNFTNKIS